MRSLRTRFILSHLIPLLVIVPLAGLALFYLLQTQVLLSDLSGRLNQQAGLIATAASGQADIFTDTAQAQRFVTGISTQITGRVILLQPSGEMVASSDPNVASGSGEEGDFGNGGQPLGVLYSLTRQSTTVSVPVLNINDEVVGIVQVTDELQGVSNQFAVLRNYIIAVLVGQLVVGGMVGWLLAVRLERPIHDITTAVESIATGQQIEKIPHRGPREIWQLGQTVNSLAERLQSLEAARRRLLANLVHELGRPLGALRSAIHVLRQGADEDSIVRHELLEGMEQEIGRLLPLLDDLTQLHGQLLGTRELNRQQVALNEWLTPLLLPWRAAAHDNGLEWQTDIPADLPTLFIDPDRMAQALGNLISNAIKYTAAGGYIHVSVGTDTEEVRFKISDSGPGISLEEQAQILEPFYRSQQQRRFPKGLGLGLTIAHDLVVAHHGRLVVDSTLGEGSSFTIYLPRG